MDKPSPLPKGNATGGGRAGGLASSVVRHAAGAGLAVLALALGVGCAPPPALDVAPAEAQTVSLYERLGGLPAITAVVDDFIVRLKKDPVVKDRFEALNVPRFREKLIEQVGEVSGGPQRYTGIDMLTLHTGMDITEEEFNAVVGDLTASLNAFQVPEREQRETLAAIGQLKDQIVAPPVSTEQRLDTVEALLGRIDTRVEELLRRLQSDTTPRASAPAPSRRIAAKRAEPAAPSQGAQSKASQPPAPQRWTKAERDLVPELIARYEKASRAPSVGKRRDLVGRPLAYTRFLQDDGEVLDLDDLHSRRPDHHARIRRGRMPALLDADAGPGEESGGVRAPQDAGLRGLSGRGRYRPGVHGIGALTRSQFPSSLSDPARCGPRRGPRILDRG